MKNSVYLELREAFVQDPMNLLYNYVKIEGLELNHHEFEQSILEYASGFKANDIMAQQAHANGLSTLIRALDVKHNIVVLRINDKIFNIYEESKIKPRTDKKSS